MAADDGFRMPPRGLSYDGAKSKIYSASQKAFSPPASQKAFSPRATYLTKNQKVQKYSYGIACCRFNDDLYATGKNVEILVVQKRCSYSLISLAMGRYTPGDKASIRKIFDGLTHEDKLLVLRRDFEKIWDYANYGRPHTDTYFDSKSKFETVFCQDSDDSKLRKYLTTSATMPVTWEIPKGRKRTKNETDINCAIREFEEETATSKDQYVIVPGAKVVYSYIDEDITYINTYYVALTKRDINTKIQYTNNTQIEEIKDMRWMNIDEVKIVDYSNRLLNIVRPAFKCVRKYSKTLGPS